MGYNQMWIAKAGRTQTVHGRRTSVMTADGLAILERHAVPTSVD
jgi:hypothetical protein